jgi:hypothetical protein
MKIIKVYLGLGLVNILLLVFACANPLPVQQPAQPLPSKSPALTYTITNYTIIKLLKKLIGTTYLYFFPENRVLISYAGIRYNVTMEANKGELCLTGIEGALYRYRPQMVSKYLKKDDSDGKVHLIALWFDPRIELNAESDKLPFIESVTTKDNTATFTYRWP